MENIYPKGTSYRRQQSIQHVVRISIVIASVTIIILLYLYIQSIYDLNSPSTSFMHYFCDSEPSSSNENIDLEHVKASHLKPDFIPEINIPDTAWSNLPVKGVYYMVVSNQRLQDAKSVIRSIEDNMSNGSRYPWILLNSQHFDEKFQKYVKRVIKAPVFFGKIDTAAWEYPSWIDVPRAEYFLAEQGINQGIYKGASLSYHQLLRYHSGLIFHHPLFRKAQYAWRVEPGSEYTCNMDEDPFLVMKTNNKKLGYVLTGREATNTMPTLMKSVKEFISFYPQYVLPENKTIMPWIVTDSGDYNNCYMWSNFQIMDLSLFRTDAYQAFFDYLDNTGNFFYERWGDGPVYTIAAAMFLKREEIQFFNSVGYGYADKLHCPYNDQLLRKCSCDIEYNNDFNKNSCTIKLLRLTEPKLAAGMSSYLAQKKLPIKNVKKQFS